MHRSRHADNRTRLARKSQCAVRPIVRPIRSVRPRRGPQTRAPIWHDMRKSARMRAYAHSYALVVYDAHADDDDEYGCGRKPDLLRDRTLLLSLELAG